MHVHTHACTHTYTHARTHTHSHKHTQDNPVVDDLKATLEYDMTSYLSEPKWMDGLQLFMGVGYESGLSIIVDLRCVCERGETERKCEKSTQCANVHAGAHTYSY